jgi:hypothetical protein
MSRPRSTSPLKLLWLASVAAAALLVAACPGGGQCDANTCDGCCDALTGTCRSGAEVTACGAFGAQCQPCAGASSCSRGSCSTSRQTLLVANQVDQKLTNYAVKVQVPYPPPGKADFSDLGFTEDGATLLSHWVEKVSGGVADVWVKIPALDRGETRSLFLHRAHPTLKAPSDGSATFPLFLGKSSSGWGRHILAPEVKACTCARDNLAPGCETVTQPELKCCSVLGTAVDTDAGVRLSGMGNLRTEVSLVRAFDAVEGSYTAQLRIVSDSATDTGQATTAGIFLMMIPGDVSAAPPQTGWKVLLQKTNTNAPAQTPGSCCWNSAPNWTNTTQTMVPPQGSFTVAGPKATLRLQVDRYENYGGGQCIRVGGTGGPEAITKFEVVVKDLLVRKKAETEPVVTLQAN